MNIPAALENINEQIKAACLKSRRSADEIELIAVSKTFPAEAISDAYGAGLRTFGESRAQDLRKKADILAPDINWHFIGHLQTNKIKYVAAVATLIQSIDSLHTAGALDQFCKRRGLTCDVLMQVNTSGETSKFGVKPQEAIETFLNIQENLKEIKLKGLMTIGPFTDDKKKIRSAFSVLREIRDKLRDHTSPESIAVLSMGMSHDYNIAIEEGSTMIRIGTALFGKRGS